jgi:hypothetical protein
VACEPFDCDTCGERHDHCRAHVVECPDCGSELRWENVKPGKPCVGCGRPLELRPCRGWPRKDASVCPKHGGNVPAVRAVTERKGKMEAARRECRKLGVAIEDADPGEVLLQGVREWAGQVAFYRQLAQELDPGLTRRTVGENGTPHLVEGIVERTFHASGRPTGQAEAHIYLRLYADAWDRLRLFAEAALRAGVDERRLRMEEAEVRVLHAAQAAACMAAGLSEEQVVKFRASFAAALRRGGQK